MPEDFVISEDEAKRILSNIELSFEPLSSEQKECVKVLSRYKTLKLAEEKQKLYDALEREATSMLGQSWYSERMAPHLLKIKTILDEAYDNGIMRTKTIADVKYNDEGIVYRIEFIKCH